MEIQFDIEFKESAPKYMQIIKSLLLAIGKGKLKRGDKIPSINQLSEEYLLSRDTVEKAYRHLIKDGVLVSVRGKGYFVNRVDIETTSRILLVFNKISNYKKQIYNSFVENVGQNMIVDLHIHHSNINIFSNLIKNSLGEYDYYVIMPHGCDSTWSWFREVGHLEREVLSNSYFGCANNTYHGSYRVVSRPISFGIAGHDRPDSSMRIFRFFKFDC